MKANLMNNFTNKKMILEDKEGSKNDPLIYAFQDPQGKKLVSQLDLHTAAEMYGLDMKEVINSKGFYEGAINKFKTEWSSFRRFVYIQISDHSKYKK